MTHYTVIWEEDAYSDLAGIWLESSDRNAITAAAHAIDQDLAENASLKGNELSEGLRTLSISGLRVCPITLAGRDAPAFAEDKSQIRARPNAVHKGYGTDSKSTGWPEFGQLQTHRPKSGEFGDKNRIRTQAVRL